AQGDRLAVADIGEAADPDLAPVLARLLLGEADAGDLRHAIGAAGNVRHVKRMHIVESGDLLDADDALVARLVREPGRAHDVADRVDSGLVRLKPLIDDDMRLLDADLGALEAEILDIADDADGKDDALRLDLARLAAGLDRGNDALGIAFQAFDRGADMDLHALLLEGLASERRDLVVLGRDDAIEHFDHRHLGAHVAVEARELDADRA